MRLHRVKLCNYRGVTDCEVEFPAEGITVIEGPNEVGKTSIPEALDLLLTKMDSSSHQDVKSAKPVGRDVGPEVEIEMSAGQYRFVYRKRWIRDKETTLTILAPAQEQRAGRDAHQRVEEILAETLDKDLWKALRIEQGAALALPGFDVPSLVSALDAAAGGDDPADSDDDLWSRICAEYEQYWTATGRPRVDRKSAEEAADEARQTVSELQTKLDAIEKHAEEIERLASEQQRLETTQAECAEEALELEKQWGQTEQLRNKTDRLTAECEAATRKRDGIASEQQHRQELIEALQSRTEELRAHQDSAQQSAPALASAIELSEQATADLEAARESLNAAEDEQRRAEADRDHLRNRIELEQLSERCERVTEAEQELQQAEKALESIKVDDDLLAQIEEAHLAVVTAEASVASVETTALRDLSIEINGEEVALSGGDAHNTVVDDDVLVVLPDTAEIRVRAGTGSQSLATERRNAQDQLHRLCSEAGVTDHSEAREAVGRRKDAERSRQDALKTIKLDLRDLTPEALKSKVDSLTERIEAYAAERPADPPVPADFEAAKKIASAKADAATEKRNEFDALQQAADDAAGALQQGQVGESKLVGKIEMAQSAEKSAAEALESARSQRPDSLIADELAVAENEASAALESLQHAQDELAEADPDSLQARMENAQAASKRADHDLKANEQRQSELRIALSLRGEDGLHSQLEESRALLEHLEREHQRSEAKAEAARLLYDTFEARRQESRRRYSGPFKQRIDELGRIVFDPSFSAEIDQNLAISKRTLHGDTLSVDQLSAGALEQLSIISRLACAAIVSPEGGGTPVIIDDALGWSDPDRLKRMGAAISAAGEQCQVIILTCTPGRYTRAGNATTIQLPTAIV